MLNKKLRIVLTGRSRLGADGRRLLDCGFSVAHAGFCPRNQRRKLTPRKNSAPKTRLISRFMPLAQGMDVLAGEAECRKKSGLPLH